MLKSLCIKFALVTIPTLLPLTQAPLSASANDLCGGTRLILRHREANQRSFVDQNFPKLAAVVDTMSIVVTGGLLPTDDAEKARALREENKQAIERLKRNLALCEAKQREQTQKQDVQEVQNPTGKGYGSGY